MKIQDILETLGLLAGAGVALAACSKPAAPASEIPGATDPGADADACLHADGCCGGHAPGDGSCGEQRAAAADQPAQTAHSTTATAWQRTWTIEPGAMAEINLELGAGDTMAATFSTDGAPLQWNVHSHEGKDAIIHARGEGTSGELRHDAAKAGMYSFLWNNEQQAPVRLTVELTSGSASVHSTHPAR